MVTRRVPVTELPETSFTRFISNPEAVMRRRRQQKLEKKLHQFRSRDGGPDTGGTLKVMTVTAGREGRRQRLQDGW